MQDLANKNILLGICGSIAAYKAAILIRELRHAGALVKVVMTTVATQFITPLTMQALSGNEVRTDLLDTSAEQAMNHIELTRWADYFIIAPASANCLSKLAHGYADDLLSTLYLVNRNPVLVCPAMNSCMWTHPATQNNCTILRQHGVLILAPQTGLQACGEYGAGCLPDSILIINTLRLMTIKNLMSGQNIMITAGATREPIDAVRFISNLSSGKMGYALAMAAYIAGANVTVISGTTNDIPPILDGITVNTVQSAQDMYEQVKQQWQEQMIFIGCAAVADFCINKPAATKIKKHLHENLSLNLQKTQDILAYISNLSNAKYIIGFAAEVSDLIVNAKEKLHKKHIDMIIANPVGINLGFEQDHNQAIVITKTQEIPLEKMHKITMAKEIIKILAEQLNIGTCFGHVPNHFL